MEWLTSIRATIEYIEENLENDITVEDVANQVFLSPFFLQRGFSVIVGYGIAEYLRNRRLYQAAVDLQKTNEKVIDIALRYCYESPESFTKAFTRFHGATPTQVRAGAAIKKFLPLKIKLELQGGAQMDYKIAVMFPFKVIGFQKEFTYEEAHREIPKFWDELCQKYANNVYAGNEPANPYERAIVDNCIGEYGICIDDIGDTKFRYLVAGKYTGGEVPEGMVVHEFARGTWAIFDCIGPSPETLQGVTTRIFNEWLPGNPDYEMDGKVNVEWYDCVGDMRSENYHSQVWVPVKSKK